MDKELLCRIAGHAEGFPAMPPPIRHRCHGDPVLPPCSWRTSPPRLFYVPDKSYFQGEGVIDRSQLHASFVAAATNHRDARIFSGQDISPLLRYGARPQYRNFDRVHGRHDLAIIGVKEENSRPESWAARVQDYRDNCVCFGDKIIPAQSARGPALMEATALRMDASTPGAGAEPSPCGLKRPAPRCQNTDRV